jgi:hypothetical protein
VINRAFALALGVLVPLSAHAQEEEDRAAIQRKKYLMAHELRLSVGAMPVDPFEKGWSASLAYTVHFEYISWEIFQITGAFLLTNTDIKDELIDTFAIPPEDFAAPRFVATTGLEAAPFYGKQALFNGAILHQSLLIGLYGGVIFGDRETIADTFGDVRPCLGIGLGWRFFVDEAISFRLDVRDFVDFRRAIRANEKFDVENVLLATLSLSFNFGRDDG